MTGKEMTKEEISKAVELMKPIYDIETPIKELMSGHYSLCSYAYNISIELIKYKRAFEILKDKGIFEFKDYNNMIFLHPEDYIWNGDIIEEMFMKVNDEEYELLEELMNDDN